jgi:hypothetical protein
MNKRNASAKNLYSNNFLLKMMAELYFIVPKRYKQARDLQKQQEDMKLQEAASKADQKL